MRFEEVLETLELETVELTAWIDRRWVLPTRAEEGYVFDEADLARLRLICELRRDLMIDDEALPVVLSLLDQVYALRRTIRTLGRAIESLPEPSREEILRSLNRPGRSSAHRARWRRRGSP